MSSIARVGVGPTIIESSEMLSIENGFRVLRGEIEIVDLDKVYEFHANHAFSLELDERIKEATQVFLNARGFGLLNDRLEIRDLDKAQNFYESHDFSLELDARMQKVFLIYNLDRTKELDRRLFQKDQLIDLLKSLVSAQAAEIKELSIKEPLASTSPF